MTPTPVAAPVASPAPAPVVTPAAAPVAAAPPVAAPGVSASDVRVIVRTLLDEALAPLQRSLQEALTRIGTLERALQEAQVRLGALERRPAAVPAATVVMTAATPAPGPVQAQAAPYASAIAAPATAAAVQQPTRSVLPMGVSVPPAPLLDVEAIERDIPIDLDMLPFDGRRRRRRNIILFTFLLLAAFGTLAWLLASSYMPHAQ